MLTPSDKARFESRFKKGPSRICWLWKGSLSRGYGQFFLKGKQRKAHILSYLLYRGEIANGLKVLHSCDNPRCVNPNHLRLGTQKENLKERNDKGRQAKGENHGRAKLTEETVTKVLSEYTANPYKGSQKDLATKYGMSPQLINDIVRNKIWKHIKR